ncbi:MAG: phosphoribosylglycinamide formyltransferase [Bacteroidales bacterium]|nr:phosphoribosylglycinamide formyltransferase [Bacteroidales bacterium]
MKNIAIMASGSGTNCEHIIQFFRMKHCAQVKLVLTNNPEAYVIKRVKKYQIETVIFNREQFYKGDEILNLLKEKKIDFIALAGFLWLVPKPIIEAFSGRIVNIHPALLPEYGGKGMYGSHVHEAVLKNGDKISGITIHFVNEKYDEGDIVFQSICKIDPDETPDSLAEKVHRLEYQFYPEIIEKLLDGIN